jgi:hypothetical protein
LHAVVHDGESFARNLLHTRTRQRRTRGCIQKRLDHKRHVSAHRIKQYVLTAAACVGWRKRSPVNASGPRGTLAIALRHRLPVTPAVHPTLIPLLVRDLDVYKDCQGQAQAGSAS